MFVGPYEEQVEKDGMQICLRFQKTSNASVQFL